MLMTGNTKSRTTNNHSIVNIVKDMFYYMYGQWPVLLDSISLILPHKMGNVMMSTPFTIKMYSIISIGPVHSTELACYVLTQSLSLHNVKLKELGDKHIYNPYEKPRMIIMNTGTYLTK